VCDPDERVGPLRDRPAPEHGDAVVASHRLALGVAGSSGKVIAPPELAPFVDDIATEDKAVDALLLGRAHAHTRAISGIGSTVHRENHFSEADVVDDDRGGHALGGRCPAPTCCQSWRGSQPVRAGP
jgi:hypothetical protein